MADASLPITTIRTRTSIRWGGIVGRLLSYFALTLGLSFTLLPFIMMILSSFKTNVEVLRVPPTFWPENFTLENYVKIFNDPKLPLLRFYGNSAFVAFFNVVSTLFTSCLPSSSSLERNCSSAGS
jgi:multiple sugar transport system permease protein